MDADKKKRIIIMVASWMVIIGVIGLVLSSWLNRGSKVISSKRPARTVMPITSKSHTTRFRGMRYSAHPLFRICWAVKGLNSTFVDDKADYVGRIRALKSGKVQMAVFTIDAYLKAGSVIGEISGFNCPRD